VSFCGGGKTKHFMKGFCGLCDYDAILEDHETLMIGNQE
jgi:hypothetical protein